MYRRILVPLDGSLRAEQAIPVAVRLARASEGMLIFVRVVEDGPDDQSGPSFFQEERQAKRRGVLAYLNAIASSRLLAGLAVIVSAPRKPISAALIGAAETYQADLLVCCEQPALAGERRVLGPLVSELSRNLAIPVLLLPETEPRYNPLAEPGRAISGLVAFSGSQPDPTLIASATALLAALAGAKPGDLRCAPLHALAPGETGQAEQYTSTLQADAHRQQGKQRAARGKVLLAEVEKSGKQDLSDVIILGLPLLETASDVLREVTRSACLLVPLQAEKREHFFHS